MKHQCASPPANLCVVAEYDDKEMSFSLLDPTKGRGEHLFTLALPVVPFFPDYYRSLSRDGTRIAIVNAIEHAIQIIDIVTGSVRVLPLDKRRFAMSVSWSADSRHLFVPVISDEYAFTSALLYLDLQGKAEVLFETQGAWLYCPVASPDGRMLAFTERIQENNAAMIERF
jgi:Tol biopolymer transport system component